MNTIFEYWFVLNRFSDTPKTEGEDIFESSQLSTAVVPKKNATAFRLLLTFSYRPTFNFSGTLVWAVYALMGTHNFNT